jgi:hypothetical protein
MAVRYEALPTIELTNKRTILKTHTRPELAHLDDPAFTVMTDFCQTPPHKISVNSNMDEALAEMKVTGVHLLLATNGDGNVAGIISSEDLLGAKPIQIIQNRRIERSQVLVSMLMAPLNEITAFELDAIQHARVGNVVKTMQDLNQHYALVLKQEEGDDTHSICGLFNTSQISKQLHENITSPIKKAETLSELQKRHSN